MKEISLRPPLQSSCLPETKPENEHTSRALVISGMHRSGTSLLANYFTHCGVNVGEDLLPPASDNPIGYYEDMDFVTLHESILEENRQTWHSLTNTSRLEVSAGQEQKISSITARRSALPLWGWKDPRTVLLLDYWAARLPDAVFVFVYREPAKVVRSLLARQDGAVFWHPPYAPRIPRHYKAARLWTRYNDRILRFMDANPSRCILFELEEIIEADADVAGIVRDFFHVKALTSGSIHQVLDRNIMSAEGHALDRMVCSACRGCHDVYAKLRERRHSLVVH